MGMNTEDNRVTYDEYRSKYEQIELAAETGVITWKQACAKIALLSIQYGYESCLEDSE